MSRWVRIQTDVFDHAVFAREPFTEREAWLWLISKAAWKDTKHRIGQAVVAVPVGSMFMTLREMQSVWRWKSDKRVRAFLSMLETEAMIETKTDAGKTQINICNYSRYQDGGRTEDASGTHAGRRSDALKTPIHQITNISGSNEPSCPEPAKAAPAPLSPTTVELTCVSGDPYPVTEADVAEWSTAFPAVDVPQQLAAMRQWLIANPTRRKTMRGMRKFVVTWLDRRQNAGAAPSPQGHSPPGRRKNPVEALASLRSRERQNEPSGPISDHGDAERVWPAEPRLRGLLADAGQAMRWPVGSGDH